MKNAESSTDFLEEKILENCQEILEENTISREYAVAIISEAISATEEFSRSMWQFYRDMRNHCKGVFEQIPPELFLNIVKHLKRIVNQKIESRNVGASIVLFLQQEQSRRFGEYPLQSVSLPAQSKISDFKGFFNDDQNDLQRLYKCINSYDAFFSYTYNHETNQLRFDGVKSMGSNSIESICEGDVLGFNISSEIPYIRIYNSGHRVVDYFMSESTGNWLARFETDIIRAIKSQINDVQEDDVKTLAKIAMQLSFLRYGAIIIITSNIDKFTESKAPCGLINEDLEIAEKSKIIYNYAAYDGAVIIQCKRNNKLKVCGFGLILNPSSDAQISDDYEILLRQTNSGSRHEKAVRFAHENPDDCILVVSENRSISILHGRDPVYWRDNSNPQAFIAKIKKREENK